jgi:coiled-coil domain-containing protein 78
MEYVSSQHELDSLIKGVPIQCMVRVKPSVGYQKEDIRIDGNRVSILDVNNRVKEEFDCNEIYSPDQTMAKVFDTSFPPYLRAFSEGVNVSVFTFGATGSGKTHALEGNQTDPGLVSLISDNIFTILEDKRYRQSGSHPDASGTNFNFSVKIRFVEVVDEDIYDLLQPTGAYGHNSLNVVTNEWDGPTINGIAWIPMSNQHQIADYFVSGCKNRTTRSNEFGKLSDKSTAIFSIEITQVTDNPDSGDTNVLVSKFHIIDLPGCEVLTEDPESLRVREGTSLNKSILALNTLMKDLATNRHGDFIYYDGSVVTQLMKDTFGGNSLTIGLFNLQYGDSIGSLVTMRTFRKCQQITNFPVINDNRILGLLRKYRVELVQLQNQVNMLPGDNADNYNLKIAELEKKLIEENLEKMKMADEKSRLVNKMQEMKLKF